MRFVSSSLPVDARRAGSLGLFIDRVDQRPADAFATRRLAGEQVLHVATRRNRRRAAMEEVMRQADQSCLRRSATSACHRLVCIEEARPGHRGDVRRQRRSRPTVRRRRCSPSHNRKPLGRSPAGRRSGRRCWQTLLILRFRVSRTDCSMPKRCRIRWPARQLTLSLFAQTPSRCYPIWRQPEPAAAMEGWSCIW